MGTVSTRLNDIELELLRKIQELEHLDKASLLRKWIIEKIEEYFMQRYGEFFKKGECSLEEAANQAGISLWRMIDYIRRQNLWPKDSLDEAIFELKHAKELNI